MQVIQAVNLTIVCLIDYVGNVVDIKFNITIIAVSYVNPLCFYCFAAGPEQIVK